MVLFSLLFVGFPFSSSKTLTFEMVMFVVSGLLNTLLYMYVVLKVVFHDLCHNIWLISSDTDMKW